MMSVDISGYECNMSRYQHTDENDMIHLVVCCSELQCVAVFCSVLQCIAVLQCVAVCCRVLQCEAFVRDMPRYESTNKKNIIHLVVCCSVLQCVAVCCSVRRLS